MAVLECSTPVQVAVQVGKHLLQKVQVRPTQADGLGKGLEVTDQVLYLRCGVLGQHPYQSVGAAEGGELMETVDDVKELGHIGQLHHRILAVDDAAVYHLLHRAVFIGQSTGEEQHKKADVPGAACHIQIDSVPGLDAGQQGPEGLLHVRIGRIVVQRGHLGLGQPPVLAEAGHPLLEVLLSGERSLAAAVHLILLYLTGAQVQDLIHRGKGAQQIVERSLVRVGSRQGRPALLAGIAV